MSRSQEKRAKRQAQQYDRDLAWFIRAPQGRRLLRDLMQRNAYATPIFNGNSRDALAIGMQTAITSLVNDIKRVSLTNFHLMESEAYAEQASAEAADAANVSDDTAE